MKYLKLSIFALLLLFFLTWVSSSTTQEEEKTGTIVIGTELQYPPFSYLEKNTISGFDIDVIKEACTRASIPYTLKEIAQFDSLIPELLIGNVDVIAAGMSPTDGRRKKVLFTNPHYNGQGFIVIANHELPEILSLEDLKGYKVVVNTGFTTETKLKQISGVNILHLDNVTEGLLALQSNQADALLIAKATATALLAIKKDLDFAVYTIEDNNEEVAFALNQKNTELKDKLNQSLKKLQEDGTLDKIKKKWGLYD
ncbi:MAG: Arginine-binding extracellular protein ArtP [Chlamydiia bacterium]|nr:Arginine-binding extracellular protein ArtP [Chlamydiia bacterium]